MVPSDRDHAYQAARQRMVEHQLRRRGIADSRVLAAMERVPRHLFVPASMQESAYEDGPLGIGHGQTISQPYIVALMTEQALSGPSARALDVGTGSGYQAAVLAEVCAEVFSIELLQPLADQARQRLRSLGYDNIHLRCGDGSQGWPEEAPFDVIIAAASPRKVPQPLIDQLALGGRLVTPVGEMRQSLQVIGKRADGSIAHEDIGAVAFVPMRYGD